MLLFSKLSATSERENEDASLPGLAVGVEVGLVVGLMLRAENRKFTLTKFLHPASYVCASLQLKLMSREEQWYYSYKQHT